MQCEDYMVDLTAYLDGELSEARTREIDSHVRACAPCAAELDALKHSAMFLDSVDVKELRPELWQNIEARISKMDPPVTNPGLFGLMEVHRWLTAGAVATMAAVVFGVWGYVRYEQSQKQLERYMNTYIQEREAQRPISFPDMPSGQNPEFTPASMREGDRNPFVEVQPIFYSNPFSAETQR